MITILIFKESMKMTELQEKAIKKIEEGCRDCKGDKRGNIVARPVADKLVEFCSASEDFARAVCADDKNFSDCIAAVIHGVGSAIADIEAYQRAVSYYFPDAFIMVDMRIILPGAANVDKPVETADNSGASANPSTDQGDGDKIISFFDIL